MEAHMKVILIENVSSLGKAGDVVEVAVGYGRNFLIPQKKALEANSYNLSLLERQRDSFLHRLDKEKQKYSEMATNIESLKCTLERQVGKEGKIFGSVTTMDIQELLTKHGIPLERRKIILSHPIKNLGRFIIPVKLHSEVTAQFTVEIVPSPPDQGKA